MAGDFAKTEAQAAALQKRINSIKNDALKGGLLLGAGVGILSLFKAPLEEAKKFQTETAKFASLGFGDTVTSQAVKFATGMNTVGTSARENMTLLSDAMAVFKNLEHAEFAAPIMAKMKFGNEAVFGQKGGEHSTKFMDMLKVIEFRGGLSSEKEFETQANFVQKVISGSRNRVDATQLLTALKTGGVALSRRSNEQFYLGAEPLIQEFGGNRYGTGAMSIYQNLVQARGSVTSQQELYRLGLLNPSTVEFNMLGKLKKAKAGAFSGSSILENEGELALLEKVLLPAFAKKGISGDENIIREIGLILGNRTGSSLMSRIYQQRAQIHTQSEANRGADNIDQLNDRAQKTLDGKLIAFHAKFHDLMLGLGNTVLPMAIRGLEILIPVFKDAADWIERNQSMVKLLAGALVVLAGGLMMRGTVLLLTAAFKGLGLAMAFQAAGGAAGLTKLSPIIGSVSTRLGQLAGVGQAFAVGWVVGTLLNDAFISGTKFGDWLGGFIARIWAFMGSEEAKSAVRTLEGNSGSKIKGGAVGPRNPPNIFINNKTVLDGRVVAQSVNKVNAQAVSAPQFNTNRFDYGLMPLPAGMTPR